MSEKCHKCGNENFAVARNMIGTRICKCGNTWAPGEAQSEVKEREFVIIERKNGLGKVVYNKGTTFRLPEGEIAINAIEYSAYQALQKENEELKARIDELEEYKAMYEGLCK